MPDQYIAKALGWSHGVLCGRGTTALWLALRAIRRRDGSGEVILPDLLCSTVLEGVLLAGFKPVFADVLPGRYTLSPDSVARLITPRTRAILAAHLFGHTADLAAIRYAAPGIPLIEDAVQGLGGWLVGSGGDMAFISFDPNKMIGGRGGVLLFNDDTLRDGIEADLSRLPDLPDLPLDGLDGLLPAAAAYADQLRTVFAPRLLRQFDFSSANLDRIRSDWDTLPARVEVRRQKAGWLRDHLAGLPLDLPDLRAGDAVWRYTVSAPGVIFAERMLRDLQVAGLRRSGLYYPLSQFFGLQTNAAQWANRLVNLWVDESTGDDILTRMVDVIAAIPWHVVQNSTHFR